MSNPLYGQNKQDKLLDNALTGKVKVISASSTAVDLAVADSGKVHVIPDLAADCTFDLPAEADGLFYEFVYVGAVADEQDWIIDSESNTNYFIGGVTHLDTDADDGADEVVPVYSDNNSNSILTILVPDAGTSVKLYCDGTHWYVNGVVCSATAPTFGDQA